MAGRQAITLTVDKSTQRGVMRAIEGVKAGVANRVVKAALGKVARAAAKVAKARAPVGTTGQLKRSVGLSFKSQPKAGKWRYKVGPRRGYQATVAGRKVNTTRYAHLAEFGRKAVKPRKRAALRLRSLSDNGRALVFTRAVRAAAPRPFLTPAWRQVAAGGLSRLAADVRAGISREAAKYAARGKSIYRR